MSSTARIEATSCLLSFDNYLLDNGSSVVLAVEATDARPSQEIASARKMLSNCANKFGLVPKTLAADTGYGKAEFLTWLETQKIVSYIPLRKHYPRRSMPFKV
jgi:hypothetical protein